jgi:beta-1,4-mannosyl-glycoprotein beta-1,4-N-acetylglucosaminyltransferase
VNVPLAGWHFSYLGGVDEINRKLERFSHQEFNKGKYKDPTRNMQRILDGKDIYGRPKLWGKASGCDLECQPVKNWFQSQPHLFSPSESHYRGTVQEAVEVFRRRSWLSRKIQRNILRIWNKF